MQAVRDRDRTGGAKNPPDPFLRVVIAGGGTGGHLYPGIAVARELLARRPGAQISFAGTAQGIESRVVPREGFSLDVIRSGGLKGKSAVEWLTGLLLLPLSVFDAWRILSDRRPQLVIGVGGYSSGPVVLAAAAAGIPTMLLEQNAVPGLTNRWLAPVVDTAAVTFEATRRFFGATAFVSGNPVRPEFFDEVESQQESGANDETSGVRILVFGGSQGAHAINVAMVEAAAELAAGQPRLRLTHQTGERDVEMVRGAYRAAGLQADVEPFLYDMGRQLGRADLIVCRAGATTLAELTVAGKAAILVPLPTATDDHQRKNAEALASAGAADLLPQANMTGAELARRIMALAGDREARSRMAVAARALARPDAAKVIVDRALALVGSC
jgi:UDP-N-acetylglucosamine--N-acetylmuramyl-(pentapeptide) pyrophosphoryl-undecaprenol N-acetylglucosamine transferase